MSSHTPGPWSIRPEIAEVGPYRLWYFVYGPDGSASDYFAWTLDEEDEAILVAIVQREEDVPLIEAAPALLEAARAVLAHLPADHPDTMRLMAAIAQAGGKDG